MEIAGTVDRIAIQESNKVEAGIPMVKLHLPDAELDLRKAEARVKILQSKLKEIYRGPTEAEIREVQAKVTRNKSVV